MTIRFANSVESLNVEHIKKNPEVHFTCGAATPSDTGLYLQIQGKAHLTKEKKERHGFWNGSLKNYFDDPDYGIIIIEPLPQASQRCASTLTMLPGVLLSDGCRVFVSI
ncbi:MAG: hypothetical protein K9J79_11365 [Desulfobacteraceae bacterium]|nr:hypothetical protein [Desulfobacteraceae bacterium]